MNLFDGRLNRHVCVRCGDGFTADVFKKEHNGKYYHEFCLNKEKMSLVLRAYKKYAKHISYFKLK